MNSNERFAKIMQILNEHDLANSARNHEFFDICSEDDLMDQKKVEEVIVSIQDLKERLEKHEGKYPEYIFEIVRQNLGYNKFDNSRDGEIEAMSKSEVFNRVCNWNCFINGSNTLKSWITDIYKVELSDD